MAVFEIQGPDGETYEVDAPDEGAAIKAFQSFNPDAAPQQPEAPAQDKALPWYTPFASAPGDALDIAKGFYSGAKRQAMSAFEPVQTPFGKMPLGPVVGPLAANMSDIANVVKPIINDPKQAMNDVGQFVDDKFGSPTRAWNTVAQNPVDTALMFAPGIGQAGKVAQANGMSKTARVLGGAEKLIDPAKPFEWMQSLSRKPIEGQTRLSEQILRKTLPKDLSAMDKIGPEAMLLDASPSMTGLARGVAANVSKGTDDMVAALMQREAGKSPRLQSGAKQIFGEGRDPNAMNAELLKKAQNESRSFYDQAKNNTPEFRDPQLENTLAYQLTDPAKGMTQSARDANMGWMNQIEDALLADTPQDAVSRLHGLRIELDNIINPGPLADPKAKNMAAAAENARNAVDDILKNRIPGMAEGDAAYASRMKQKDAFNYGYDSLEGGKTAIWPETFAKDTAKMPADYVAQGQAARIGNAMGTQANDLAAIKKMLGGDGDFNRAKLAQTFGQEKVNKGINLLDAEGAMSQNFADIARNSKTAQSLVAQDMIKDVKPYRVDSGLSALGLASKVPVAAANALMGRLSGRVQASTSDALAKVLVGNKATVQELLKSLDKSGKVPLADKVLVRALLFSGGLQASQATP
jgi:DNA uptake protein ComE-like DNA-binding protein